MTAPKMTPEKKKRMFELIDKEPSLTKTQLAERLNICASTIRYHISVRNKAQRLPKIKQVAAERAEVMP